MAKVAKSLLGRFTRRCTAGSSQGRRHDSQLFDYGAIDPDGALPGSVSIILFKASSSWPSSGESGGSLLWILSWAGRQEGGLAVCPAVYLVFRYVFDCLLGNHAFDQVVSTVFPPLTAKYPRLSGFQLFLTGPSEELIFRAFAITMLGLVLQGRGFSGKASNANIAAAVIFGLAHVSFSFAPFQVSYSPMQVIFASVLGLFYGDCLEKSGSVLSMMMHSIGNVLVVSATILITMLMS